MQLQELTGIANFHPKTMAIFKIGLYISETATHRAQIRSPAGEWVEEGYMIDIDMQVLTFFLVARLSCPGMLSFKSDCIQ